MSYLEHLSVRLRHEGSKADALFPFEVTFLAEPREMLQVQVRDPDSLPIFMAVSGPQLVVVVQLFTAENVKADQRAAMHERMLELNIPMPLSSYGKMGEVYVAFGALALDATIDEVLLELRMLHANASEAVKAVEMFLRGH